MLDEPTTPTATPTPDVPICLVGSREDRVALVAKLAEVMGHAAGRVQKSRTHPQLGHQYATIDDIVDVVRPLLVERGIISLPRQSAKPSTWYEYEVTDRKGTHMERLLEVSCEVELTDGAASAILGPFPSLASDTPSATAAKKALTAAVRYLYTYGFLLGGSDSDDESAHDPDRVTTGHVSGAPARSGATGRADPDAPINDRQRKMIFARAKSAGVNDVNAFLAAITGNRITSIDGVKTNAQMDWVLGRVRFEADARAADQDAQAEQTYGADTELPADPAPARTTEGTPFDEGAVRQGAPPLPPAAPQAPAQQAPAAPQQQAPPAAPPAPPQAPQAAPAPAAPAQAAPAADPLGALTPTPVPAPADDTKLNDLVTELATLRPDKTFDEWYQVVAQRTFDEWAPGKALNQLTDDEMRGVEDRVQQSVMAVRDARGA